MGGGVSDFVSAVRGLGGGYSRVLRGTLDWPSPDGSTHQSEKDVGGSSRLDGCEPCCWRLLFYYATPLCTRLLEWGLIQRRDGIFALETPAMAPVLSLTAVLNVAAQLGDLVESLIKRGAGVKDSGTILPGHGGMLDRIDALLFAAPVLWFYAAWRVMQ